MLTYENKQFCLSGSFNLNSLVKKVNDIYRLDDRINDGKQNISYSLFCSSVVSNEERKSIVTKFNSKQKWETSTINTMSTSRSWSQQRKSNVTVRWIEQRKMSFLKFVLKKYKEIAASKKQIS